MTAVAGSAAAWPLAARAQQGERMRRVGVLSTGDDAEGRIRLAAFTYALKQLGWSDGRNLRIDTRYATADNVHGHAIELVALAPDVLVAATGTATAALRPPRRSVSKSRRTCSPSPTRSSSECARQSWCDPAGGSPAQVRSSVRLVASVAWPTATAVAKRTQRLHGVWD